MNYIEFKPLLYASTDQWLETFLSSIQSRPSYHKDEECFQFDRLALRVLGVPLEEDDYANSLYDMKQKSFIHVLSEELDKTIDPKAFQSIQEILMIHQQEPKGLSISRLIAFMYGRDLIPKHSDPFLNRHIQQSVIKVAERFKDQHKSGLQTPEFRRFLIDIVKWLKNHWEKWAKDMKIGDDFPKVVWYGDLNTSQKYFLMLLMELGCDVLIFHPEAKDEFQEVDPENKLSLTYKYSQTASLKPFPTKLRERQTTVAYRANKQLEKMMNDHESGVYKAWQFRDYIPSSVTLKMTYDDVFIYAPEKAMLRPGFQIEGEKVFIPSIFAKIQGVSKDRKEYWDRMHSLIDNPLALCIRQFPFTPSIKANYQFHYNQSLDSKGELSVEKILKGNWWRYGYLPNGLQGAIAFKIKECCENPPLKQEENETKMDLTLFIFKQLSMLSEAFLKLLQRFDYAQEVPRIILYNMETNGELSRGDAAVLLFLNQFGADIIHYNPAGHNDLEKYIDPIHYDVHWLEDVEFEMNFQDVSNKGEPIFKKIMKKIF